MKAKFTLPSESYVGKVDAVVHFVTRIKSASGVEMTAILGVNAISALCAKRFDDLTGTIFSGRHQSITVWISYLYLLGLNVSNAQIAQELDLCASDSQRMAEQLRQEVVRHKPPVQLAGEVECDEVTVVAGHKGIPAAIKNRDPRRNRLKGARGRGTLATEKPPVFGMVQRDGQVRIVMLPNVQQKTIKPLIEQTVSKGTLIYTDEYAIYSRLEEWGYSHKTALVHK